MISREDFTAYTATVVEVIAAAKDFEESALVSSSARGKFRCAIHNLETSWTSFFSDGHINGAGLMPFVNAIGEFLDAETGFLGAESASAPSSGQTASLQDAWSRTHP